MKKIDRIEELKCEILRHFVAQNDLKTVIDTEDTSMNFEIERWQYENLWSNTSQYKYIEMDNRLCDIY